ncbi:MAG: hypothetical protein SO100_07470 [Dysosmobacter sp.]|nr:hypothetical protein [Dysosmobacter sp.]
MNGKRVLKTNRKAPVALVAILVLLCCAVAGTVAYLVTSTGPVTNTFTPASVTTEVVEEFNGQTKSNVKIQNTGDIPAYIRVAVIVNWADDKGNVSGTPVKDSDYVMDLNIDTGTTTNAPWFKGSDGYYYCKTAVKSVKQDTKNCYTPVLIKSCIKATGAQAPAGYDLQVTILADGIQSVPADAVQQAWPAVQVSGGQLTAGTSN